MSYVTDAVIELRDNPDDHGIIEYTKFGYSLSFLVSNVISQTIDNIAVFGLGCHPMKRAFRDVKQVAAEQDY